MDRLAPLLLLATLLPAAPAAADPAAGRPLAVGERMPALAGHDLTGRHTALPEAARGRVALVLLGFSYESRHVVETWAERWRARFAADSAVTLFEVPMIGGMARLARPFIERGMRRGTPRELHGNVVTFFGDTRPWRRHAGWSPATRDHAHLLLLDRDGTVRWTRAAGWDAAAFAEAEREAARLAGTAAAR